jgi:DNA repair protein RadA/Sms
MVKRKTLFACTQCGAQFPKWMGHCAACNAWNTLIEETVVEKNVSPRLSGYADSQSEIMSLGEVPLSDTVRYHTNLKELDHVLGGGLVAGSVVLIGGDPGIGKSTLLLQASAYLNQSHKVLYVTGEESLQQVAMRAGRLELKAEALNVLTETQVEQILHMAKTYQPKVMVIDSIQTIFTELLQSAPGSVGQVRESAAMLVRYAKKTHTALFLVGHVTKEGALAGPRVLEHMVDAVLYFEGEQGSRYRIIRAIKNRFGAVNELGVFAMTDKGLREVNNPSAILWQLGRGHALYWLKFKP